MRHVFKAGVLAALSPVVFVFILDMSSLVKILQVIQSAGRVKVADPCAIGEHIECFMGHPSHNDPIDGSVNHPANMINPPKH